jgi:hypothetical protein
MSYKIVGRHFRLAVSIVSVLVLGLTGVVLEATTGTASAQQSGGLHAKPWRKLVSGDSLTVYGRNLTAGDVVVLMECLRIATDPTGCDPATTTLPVQISATGKLPATKITVATGTIGTGTCGTSKADDQDCEIALQDLSGTSTFVAYVNIRFTPNPPPTTTTSITLPSIPITIPTTGDSTTTTSSTTSTTFTLPTIPVTLPSLP